GEDAHQSLLIERIERGKDRQPTDKLGNHAELEQVVAGDLAEQLTQMVLAMLGVAAETDGLTADPASDDVVQPDKGAAANEENVGSVDLDVLLLGVLASTLGRNVANRPFQHLEQGLLDAFTAHVAGDADVLTGLGDLVDFVDIDDAALGGFDVKVSGVKQLQEKVFNVLADITGF